MNEIQLKAYRAVRDNLPAILDYHEVGSDDYKTIKDFLCFIRIMGYYVESQNSRMARIEYSELRGQLEELQFKLNCLEARLK